MWIMLKTIILFLNNHKRNIIIGLSIFIFFKVPLLIKFHCSKRDANWWCFKNPFACLKQLWTIIFFKCPFYLSNVHHSFSKLKRILILMIIKAKHLKFIKFFWKHIWTYLFQILFLTLKIMNLKICL